jgi:chromosome segregation ATPase
MPNDKLLATLQETRLEIVDRRGQRINRLQEQNGAINDARTNLQIAQNRAQVAVRKDEDIKGKMRELTNHLNGLTDKPQFFLDKLTRLGAEQLETYRERQAQGEIVRQCQPAFTDAQTRLSIAQTDLEASDKDVGGIDAQIREVQGY